MPYTIRRRQRWRKHTKRKRARRGGGSSGKQQQHQQHQQKKSASPLKKAATIFLAMQARPDIKDPTNRMYDYKKTPRELMSWTKDPYLFLSHYDRNLDDYTDYNIGGTGKFSQRVHSYGDHYKNIAIIWGYRSSPDYRHEHYEDLTNHDYGIYPLRSFQDISDPLMRNLQRLGEGEPLLPSDTTDFLVKVYATIDTFKTADAAGQPYVRWFCDEVLPHFLKQGNVATLLYELADQKWQPNSSPNKNDESILLYLSLAARLFLLLTIRDWERMEALLRKVGI